MTEKLKMVTSSILDGQISLIDVDTFDRPFIQLNEGRYAGVKYQYGEVRFDGIDGDPEAVKVSFEYQVFHTAGHETDGPAFRNYIGDVLSYIIAVSNAKSLEEMAPWNDYKLD